MDAAGTIDGNSIVGYVRSIKQHGSLCTPPQSAIITLAPDFPAAVKPGNEVVLYLPQPTAGDGLVKSFTGYVSKVTYSRPTYDLVVECHDTFIRAVSKFIDEQITTGYTASGEQIRNYTPLSTRYWIGYLCGLCQLSYSIDMYENLVPAGVQLGLRTVAEALQDIIAYSSQYVYVNADGVAVFKRIPKNGTAEVTLDEVIDIEWRRDDEWTRNVVKVYGMPGTGLPNQRVFVSKSVGVEGIVPDRVTAVASPMIQTTSEADRVADYLLEELGEVSQVATVTVEGTQNASIGTRARVVYEDFDLTGIVTSREITLDEDGYVSAVTIGEKCPRIAGWSFAAPPVYAGTLEHGVYKSQDLGQTWAEYNTGLPESSLNAARLGFNYYGEGMAIINGRLYYTNGTDGWSARSLPAPVNTAGDDPPPPGYGSLIAVDALGGAGRFAVLTSGTSGSTSGSVPVPARSWVYTCESSGSAPGLWTSTQVRVDRGAGGTNPTYNVSGIDLSSKMGIPYIIVRTSGSVYYPAPNSYNVAIEKYPRPVCNDWLDYYTLEDVCVTNPTFPSIREWGVAAMDDSGILTMYAIVYSGTYKDNLFVYGVYDTPGIGYCPRDNNGYYRWPFQANGTLRSFDTKTGRATWTFPMLVYSRPLSEVTNPSIFNIYFNIFYSPDRSINFSSCTFGDGCGDSHAIGRSPHGDLWGPLGYGGGVDPNTPYPILSDFGTGRYYSEII